MNSIHTFWGISSKNPLDGIMENTDQKAILEGTDQGVALENADHMEQRSSLAILEDRQYLGEIDEVRVNETAEIMADVFSEDVLRNWPEMTLGEKSAKLNEYYIRAGANLGIHTKGVIVEPIPCSNPGMISFGYNSGDGYIHLNAAVVEDPSMLGQVLDTASHEMRHQFQSDVLANPQHFGDIPKGVLNTWRYEMANYIDPDYDYQGYYEQAIECDARGFSEEVLSTYKEKMNLR